MKKLSKVTTNERRSVLNKNSILYTVHHYKQRYNELTMITPPTSFESWREWFDSKESADTINKTHQAELFTAFGPEDDNEKCIEEIIQHEETTFLFKVNFGSTNVNIFHHLKKIGGTLYHPTTLFGFIQGVGQGTTWVMTPDTEILGKKPEGDAIPTPTPTTLNNVTSLANIEALELSATISYLPRNFIPIPPFLLGTVQESIATHNGDAKQVMLSSAKAITAFDITNAGNDEFKDKAKGKCKDFLFWLYLVSKDNDAILPTPTIGCSNEAVARKFREIENDSLAKTQNGTASDMSEAVGESLKRPFEVLATTASTTADFVEKLTQLQKQSNEKATKSFKKIPKKYQNMILIASSTGEATNVDYEQAATEFFKTTNVLHAQVLLNSELEAAKLDCTISPAMATALSHGGFLWSSPLTPSGFSASTIVSEGVLRTDTLYEGMVLDYSTKHDMSVTSLAKLTKTQVMYPATIETAVERIQAIQVLAAYFFGRRSFISQGLTKMVNQCLDNKQMLRTKLYMDSQFIAKLIYAVDDRIYQWLRQCSTADAVTDTALELIDFDTLFKDILLSRFDISLPPNIAKIPNRNNNETTEDKPKKTKTTPAMVKNDNPVQEWKVRNGERWETIFRAKLRHGPTLSLGCKPCLKYHAKGFCFDDCSLIKSHHKLNEEDSKATANFIKELRGE